MYALSATAALVLAHVLPGRLLVDRLALGRDPLERWTAAAVLGGPLAALLYWGTLASGRPSLYWLLLAVVNLAALAAVRRTRQATPHSASETPPRWALVALAVWIAAVEGAYLLTTGNLFDVDARGDLVMDPVLQKDTLFHLGLVRALESSYPPQLLSVSGVEPTYHFGYHLQLAAWSRHFGVEPLDGLYRVGACWSLGLLLLSTFLLGRRLFSHPGTALGASILVLGSGLGFLFPRAPGAEWWSLVFLDAGLVSILIFNPLLPALPLLFIGLVHLDDYLSQGRVASLTGSVFALGSLLTVKVFLGAQILAALCLAAARARGGARLRRTALALAAVTAPFFLLLVSAGSNTKVGARPLEIVRYSLEKLDWDPGVEALAAVGRGAPTALELLLALGLTTFWLAGFLGVRLAGLKGIAGDLGQRQASVRQVGAIFALVGFPLALVMRIAPAEATGLARSEAINDTFWFATQSGVMLWFWTAAAVFDGRAIMKVRMLKALAAVTLSMPATIQHLVHKTSLPADVVPAGAVEAAAEARNRSRPGEVWVGPPSRIRPSVVAYLAGRPVVHDPFVDYDYMFVAREELTQRRHAVALFWWHPDPGYASWFLSRYQVRWIYATPDFPLPQGSAQRTTEVFANQAATLHRVSDDTRLLPILCPERLPMGIGGAPFFGEGWEVLSGRPRARLLLTGWASLYLPLEARPLHLTLHLEAPHEAGWVEVAGQRASLHPGDETLRLRVPGTALRQGLNHIRLNWAGLLPLRVVRVDLRQHD